MMLLKAPEFTLKPKILHFLKISIVSSRFLLSLVNDILDLAKIEHNEMHLNMDEFSIKEIYDDLERMFEV